MAKTFKNNYLFDYLRNILTDKSADIYHKHISDPEFLTSYQPFMILSYLSMSRCAAVRNVILDNQFTLEHMQPTLQYKYLISVIPKQSNSFIKYIK